MYILYNSLSRFDCNFFTVLHTPVYMNPYFRTALAHPVRVDLFRCKDYKL